MKREDIPNMTEQECADELTFSEFERLLRKARARNLRAEEAERNVFQAVEDMCIDIERPSKAENAETLGDAISCFIQYGEYGATNIMKEIRAAYTGSEVAEE